ncbi:SulP family inorganic anion transporter [Methylomarinum vadi]|uniref:SulP family inorganic anion transporter n=1 Tax=Methylomarinum vadi TaxID=438855 RepID=UPI0009FF7FBA|nr:SulP family inorganic anion transporter [Methylomarinum vadi]
MEDRTFKLANLSGDLFGGLTAGVVALPLALAFGVQSGLGAIAGLYGAIMLGFIAALFGGTPTQISGPTGPMTVVASTVVASAVEIHSGSLEQAMGSVVAIFMLAGLFQILLGMLKVGEYIRYIPYPVISGFMTGIGVIIISLELFPLLGHASPKRIPDVFVHLPEIIDRINVAAIGLATATIVIIYLIPRLFSKIPSTLAALVLGTLATALLELDVPCIGEIPQGLPSLHFASLAKIDLDLPILFVMPALTLAALGTLDSLLTSVVADNMTKTQHDSNRELFGQGLGNIASALIGGIPGAGATMRTVVNIKSGGRTRFSGMVHSIAMVLVLLGAGQYAALVSQPVLAGILITVGIGIIDYKGLKHIRHVPRIDSIVMLTVLAITVFADLLVAIAVGMVLASVLFMKKMSDILEAHYMVGPVGSFAREESWSDELNVSEKVSEQVYIKHFGGPIFFGFVNKLQAMTRALPQVGVVIFRMKNVPYIDQSGIYAIEEAVMALQAKGVLVLITGIQEQPRDMLMRIDLIPDLVPEQHIFQDFADCIKAVDEGTVCRDSETGQLLRKDMDFCQ